MMPLRTKVLLVLVTLGILAGIAWAARPETGTLQYVAPNTGSLWTTNGSVSITGVPTINGSVSITGTAAVNGSVAVTGTVATNGSGFNQPVTDTVFCPDVSSKSEMVVVTTPDAGLNCMIVPANVRSRIYATGSLCADPNGVIPSSCSTTAVSTGLRVAADSPEPLPLTNATFLAANGSAWVSGTKYINLCALPSTGTAVLQYASYTNCSATP